MGEGLSYLVPYCKVETIKTLQKIQYGYDKNDAPWFTTSGINNFNTHCTVLYRYQLQY